MSQASGVDVCWMLSWRDVPEKKMDGWMYVIFFKLVNNSGIVIISCGFYFTVVILIMYNSLLQSLMANRKKYVSSEN